MNKSLFSEVLAYIFLFVSLNTINQILQLFILIVGLITAVYGLYLMRMKQKNDDEKRHTKKE